MKKILFLLAFLINALLVFSQAPIPLNRLSRSSDRFMMMMSDTNRYASYQHFNYWLSKFADSLNLQNPYWLGSILPQQSVSIGAERHNFIISNGIIGSFATDTTANGWILQSYVSGLLADGVGKIGGRNYITGKNYGLDFNGATGTVLSGNVNVTLANEQVQDGLLNASYQYGMFASSAGVVNYVRSDTLEYQPGLKWTLRTGASSTTTWQAITYGGGLFVAVSQAGTGNRVQTSPDGVNWTLRTEAAANNWSSVTYGNGLFVAVSISGTGNRVMTSPDGITWTSRTSATDNNWSGVTYGNGLFVAVANSGTGNRVMTSPDGITWTSRTSAADNFWNGITYGNGLFVAVSSSGTGDRVMTSPDGITWTSRTSAADVNWQAVTYGNGLFVAVANSGTGSRIMYSTDGITWTSTSITTDNWREISYGKGLFVASGNGTNMIITSPDGINWTYRTSPVSGQFKGSAYGNGIFVIIAQTSNRILTSNATAETITPNNNIFQGDYTFPSYPNTRNDAGAAVNMLSTSASGVEESHPLTETFGAIWLQSSTGVTNTGTQSQAITGFSVDLNDNSSNYVVFGDTVVQISLTGCYTISMIAAVSSAAALNTDGWDVQMSYGGSVVPPNYVSNSPFIDLQPQYVNRSWTIKTTSSNVSVRPVFSTTIANGATTADISGVMWSIKRNY